MSYFADFFRRLRGASGWIVGQFVGMPVLFLLGLAWTRLPDRHLWQVALTLVVPLALIAGALALQAGMMRGLLNDEQGRVRLMWGAFTLLLWAAIAWAAWALLDWCDDRIPAWGDYLHSLASAHWRARVFTVEHLKQWLTLAEWIVRWIIVPGKVIPWALSTAEWGWRLRLRSVQGVTWNWRWWPVVVLASLVGAAWPQTFFTTDPHGTVSAQVWRVSFKLTAVWLLAVGSWVLLLGWGAMLLGLQRKGKYAGEPHSTPVELPLPESGENIARNG